MDKQAMLAAGKALIDRFCALNGMDPVPVIEVPREAWMFGTCAYYRPVHIKVCVAKTAHIGTAGRAWSYPGYVVDRTAYGVMAHELGHHADHQRSEKKGAYFGDYSYRMREASGEEPITSYAPNTAEWFAEIFRLFVTNPELLEAIRPRTYALLRKDFEPVETRPWGYVLLEAPARTQTAAMRKVNEAQRFARSIGRQQLAKQSPASVEAS